MGDNDDRSVMRMSLSVWLLCASVLVAGPELMPPPAAVEPGMEYIHHRIGDGPWSIHVVKIRRSGARFQLISSLAQDTVCGLATVSDQVRSLSERPGRPVAAVNGDFFHIRPGPYQGDPIGLHIVRGEAISSPVGTSFWLDKAGQPHIGQVQARFRATGPDGLNVAFGLNESCAEDGATLYTPTVGESTRTSGGLELLLEQSEGGEWLPVRLGRRYAARIAARSERGNTALGSQTMVLSFGSGLAGSLPPLRVGTVLSLDLRTSPDLSGATMALGGGPILVDAGESPPWQGPQPRHPRTALGWNDEQFVLVVVDGRQGPLSVGMTYPELAAVMRRLGCTYAMNLDGGGSSTLWLGGRVMNSPSDGRERRVANSLIVLSAEPDAGRAEPED